MDLFLYGYRHILYPTAKKILPYAARANRKIQKGIEQRSENGGRPWLKGEQNTQPIWIHCSSGEFEYSKSVIRSLKEKHPNTPIMVTFLSPTVEPAIRKFQGVDFFSPLPWDEPDLIEEFIDYHNPRALLISRTDLWPEMLNQCKQKNIPTLLFSKTVNAGKSKLSRMIENRLLNMIDAVFVVSKKDHNALTLNTRVEVGGDTRYDQCLYRISQPNVLKDLRPNPNKKTFILGSSWPEDEALVLPNLEDLKHRVNIIIAPHEPTPKHVNILQKLLLLQGHKSVLYSEIEKLKDDEILIIDEVGILADLYSWADIAFIGGSFRRGCHSVMEALAHGCQVFVGPRHLNNREALEFKELKIKGDKETISPVQVLKGDKSDKTLYKRAIENWGPKQKANLRAEFEKKAGSTDKVIQWVEQHLKH